MKTFTLRLADREFEILEQAAERTERRKVDIVREIIRSLPSGQYPTAFSRKLTRADVARVVDCLYERGWFDIVEDELPGVTEDVCSVLVED